MPAFRNTYRASILVRRCCLKRFLPLQDHVDYLSIQALLFQHKQLSLYREAKHFFAFSKRLSD